MTAQSRDLPVATSEICFQSLACTAVASLEFWMASVALLSRSVVLPRETQYSNFLMRASSILWTRQSRALCLLTATSLETDFLYEMDARDDRTRQLLRRAVATATERRRLEATLRALLTIVEHDLRHSAAFLAIARFKAARLPRIFLIRLERILLTELEWALRRASSISARPLSR